MSRRAYTLLVVLVALLVAAWLLRPAKVSADAHLTRPPAASGANDTHAAAQSAARNPQSAVVPAPAFEPAFLAATGQLNAPAGTILADLRIVDELLHTFRTNFPRDGNPVGTNVEITAALTGKNKLRLAFLSPRHPAINRDGELCDRWGTPFFFHAESATHMEIRSAGPDKKMWTTDDVAFAP